MAGSQDPAVCVLGPCEDRPPQQNICLWTEHVATARAAYGRPEKQPKIRVTQSSTLSFSKAFPPTVNWRRVSVAIVGCSKMRKISAAVVSLILDTGLANAADLPNIQGVPIVV
jgi:hypothetical protein